MKTKIYLIAMLSLVFWGCEKEKLKIDEANINIRAKINNVEWKGRANAMVNTVLGRDIYGLGGAWTDGSTISITFEPIVFSQLASTYDLTGLALYVSPQGSTFQSTSGTMVITSVTDGNKISGTFNFIATDRAERDGEVRVTEGTFTNVEIR